MLQRQRGVGLGGGEPVQRLTAAGRGLDGALGAGVGLGALVQPQVGEGEGAVHADDHVRIGLGDGHEQLDGLLRTAEFDQGPGAFDLSAGVVVDWHRASSGRWTMGIRGCGSGPPG